jgi:hypothetical protein
MHKFHVYQGNYSYFIRDALLKREGWEEVLILILQKVIIFLEP